MTRVVLDANVCISFLLYPSGDGPPAKIVRAALLRRYIPIASPRLLQEIQGKVVEKPYLANRISQSDISEFFNVFTRVGETRDDADTRFPAITRDPKDDYLLANAVIYRADFLVTGDRDLLVIGEFEGVRIVSPAEFAAILDTEG